MHKIRLLNLNNKCKFFFSIPDFRRTSDFRRVPDFRRSQTKIKYINNYHVDTYQYIPKINSSNYSTKITIQYVSDLHIDTHQYIPKIKPSSNYLAICGDIGQPYAKQYKEFIENQSKNFEKIFFVPGNHDFDLGSIYNKDKVKKWEPYIKKICSELKNVYYLNCDTYQLNNDVLIMGSILWSKPILYPNDSVWVDFNPYRSSYLEHVIEHNKHVEWISKTINQNKDKKIIMLTHFVPTFQLIEDKYKKRGEYCTSRYATDLEYLIKEPIKAWICGHTHSVMTCNINGITCAVNAYGYGYEDNKDLDKINNNKIILID
jgi:predicted MPP superfamily phosphohydrolase